MKLIDTFFNTILFLIWKVSNEYFFFFLGNFKNPLINRWGLNLFWNQMWFKDKNYSIHLNNDKISKKLLLIFLYYGMNYYKNIYINKYWFNKIYKINNFFNEFYLKYYKLLNFKNKLINANFLFYNRIKKENIYNGKIWIFKYQNWFILNISFFQSLMLKKKSINKKKINTNFFLFLLKKKNKKKNILNLFIIKNYNYLF